MQRDRLLRNKEQFLDTGVGKILDDHRVPRDDRSRGKKTQQRKAGMKIIIPFQRNVN